MSSDQAPSEDVMAVVFAYGTSGAHPVRFRSFSGTHTPHQGRERPLPSNYEDLAVLGTANMGSFPALVGPLVRAGLHYGGEASY